jgi:hypothetical protein
MQRSVIQELDFATLANVICTCKLWSKQSELMWELSCLKVYPNARKVDGFSWRWIALSKQDILVTDIVPTPYLHRTARKLP